ncbi:hypothetical protein M3Y98_00765900 [Aphelenchoides besseyi]|nr:hypothetical protein M3Y98_00765900 [Aphelenchoides besseyi]
MISRLIFIPIVVAQIQPLLPSIQGSCLSRPPACVLNCAYGFVSGFGSSCLCLCQSNPCASRICPLGENCEVRGGLAVCQRSVIDPRPIPPTRQSTTVGECPRLVGGSCATQCRSDADCKSSITELKCCSNGCGFECVQPINYAPIKSSLAIQPIGTTKLPINSGSVTRETSRQVSTVRSGQCPSPNLLKQCITECANDSDCPGQLKCCQSACGSRICSPIERPTTCVHLLSAIQRLSSRHLATGYVPTCHASGTFSPVQCDRSFCWCVNIETGHEIVGTKLKVEERADLNCAEPRDCPVSSNDCLQRKVVCPFGFKTDENGCPSSDCECKDICEKVRCDRKFHECQLIEPDCGEPPCQPVPKCILNPCPNGPPATLPNGVTALCTDANPCYENHWCHQIGYNGLGFCCREPEAAARLTSTCEARAPRVSNSSTECDSECRVDADCENPQRCCFDGCGLKCTEGKVQERKFVGSENRVLLYSLDAECPKLPRSLTCEKECKDDNDCTGLRRCCKNGCSSVCAYPQKTTACLHDAITFDLNGLLHAPRCNSHGEYHEIQCDDERCYCAEPKDGSPIPHSIVPKGRRPVCNHDYRTQCQQLRCSSNCQHGYQFDENGCPTCECKNPCRDLECKSGFICTMIPVECDGDYCPQQPRCVPNICQGNPLSNDYSLIEQCNGTNCPHGFTCQSFGLPGSGGLCCPLGISSQGGVKPTVHSGQCPTQQIRLTSRLGCLIQCKADADCQQNEKCCFDSCGTSCIITGHKVISTTKSTRPREKIGECRSLRNVNRNDCRSGVDECQNDLECPGTQKCCSDGCYRRCMDSHRTTACLHLKTALKAFGRNVKCTSTGEFETTQCNDEFCWCANVSGAEIEGTRVASSLTPDCRMRRVCAEQECTSRCANGYRKDANGCNTCECSTPCDDLKCQNDQFVCIAHDVECLTNDCSQVPVCVPNLCPSGRPLSRHTCQSTTDCPHGSHCRLFGLTQGGYCCSGVDDQKNGKCPQQPNFPLLGVSCRLQCRSDDDCSRSVERCCFNGCGTECMPSGASKSNSVATNRHPGVPHQTTCPNARDLGHSICGKLRDNECENGNQESKDSECNGNLKCCFNGCARSCLPPQRATACVHLAAAVHALQLLGNRNSFTPICRSDGRFAQTQRFGLNEWCVDERGREVAGTRSNSGSPNCQHPRSCPALICRQQCELGFELNADGCEECACRDPCRSVTCPLDHVCRLVSPQECELGILNVCIRGEPLTRPNSPSLFTCNDQKSQRCPPGWHCTRFGFESIGYCCAGVVPESDLILSATKCPATPQSLTDHRERKVECRWSRECAEDEGPCCFNGHGTSCSRSSEVKDLSAAVIAHQTKTGVQGLSPIKPINNEPTVADTTTSACPVNRFQNPGCRTECKVDSDCRSEFQRCCSYGCGRRCLYPMIATPCVHRLAVLAEEQQKLTIENQPVILRDSVSNFTSTVQCASSALYRRTQCNQRIGQCWCVNPADGNEIPGTRSSIAVRGEPNCLSPRKCAVQCSKEESECEHGIRLDRNGCPTNGVCECRNPCETFQCALPDEICVLRSVQCPQPPCPKQPTCRPSPCAARTLPLRTPHQVVETCRHETDCAGGEAECRALATSDDENGYKVGVCCQVEIEHTIKSTKKLKGICPLKVIDPTEVCSKRCSSDSDCSSTETKCCVYGCSSSCEKPGPSTNCMHMMNAVEKLQNDGVPTRLSVPSCDNQSGNYVATQCDKDGNCWCVDRTTGAEVVASRSEQPRFDVCKDELTLTCPFGLDLDRNGCPKTSQCRCRNPCDFVDCPADEICLLRSRDCAEEVCLPVPICERNPCDRNERPAQEARGFSQFACLLNSTRPCPGGYQCTGFDERQIGICCPLSSAPTHSDDHNRISSSLGRSSTFTRQVVCPHGEIYTRDREPVICSALGPNTCPSTHYCVTNSDERNGNCCPTKRFVCNLEQDIGNCNQPQTRFYYDSESQACLPFVFAGCNGTLNNFETETACSKFCIGVGQTLNDDSEQIYSLGFTLTGPLRRSKHTDAFNERLRDYLMATFQLDDSAIRDLYVKDDNTIRFNLMGEQAQQKSQDISKAVSNGQFKFRFGDEIYQAESQSLFSQQIDTNMKTNLSGLLFWVLLIASILFALSVIAILCCVCSFVRSRAAKDDRSAVFRGGTPTFGPLSGFVGIRRRADGQVERATSSTGSASTVEAVPATTQSADDVRRVRVPRQRGRAVHPTIVGHDPQAQRRSSSRTTLYY